MMLRCSRKYDIKTDSIVYANNQPYTRENYRSASIGDFADALFNFCRSMCVLKVDNAEYSLLTAIIIFSGKLLVVFLKIFDLLTEAAKNEFMKDKSVDWKGGGKMREVKVGESEWEDKRWWGQYTNMSFTCSDPISFFHSWLSKVWASNEFCHLLSSLSTSHEVYLLLHKNSYRNWGMKDTTIGIGLQILPSNLSFPLKLTLLSCLSFNVHQN